MAGIVGLHVAGVAGATDPTANERRTNVGGGDRLLGPGYGHSKQFSVCLLMDDERNRSRDRDFGQALAVREKRATRFRISANEAVRLVSP